VTGRRGSRSPRPTTADLAGTSLSLPPSDDSGSHDGRPPGRTATRSAPAASATSRTAIGRAGAPAADARRALGARAEDAVVAHLAAQGVEIVARNARVGRLEIDVVARDGPVIVIIEVRTRGAGSYVRALDSIDASKRARVRRAGERLWRATFSRVRGVERMRFDAASVTFLPSGEATVEIVKAAF
jgi:putative endonuclease